MKNQRLSEVDKLKGLAIFLVVLGHIVAREPPAGNQWYVDLKATVYLFHMPLFMFLSGLILAYARRKIDCWSDYGKYLRGKFVRLMPAYLLFSLIVFSGKKLLAQRMHVDNNPGSLLSYFDVLTNPLGSYCAYLWYIYVLFLFYAIAPAAYYVTRDRIQWILPLAFAVHFVPLPGWFGLSSLGEYALVFALGCLAGDHYKTFAAWLQRYGAVFVAPFVVLLFYAVPLGVPKFFMGLLAIPACHALMTVRLADAWGVLKTLGAYTFPIYLMNTMFIGVTKGLMLKAAPWDNSNFYWFAPAHAGCRVAGTDSREVVIDPTDRAAQPNHCLTKQRVDFHHVCRIQVSRCR